MAESVSVRMLDPAKPSDEQGDPTEPEETVDFLVPESTQNGSLQKQQPKRILKKMSKKYVAVGVAVALVVAIAMAIGLGVGLSRRPSRQEKTVGDSCVPDSPAVGSGGPYSRAAVAADAGRCSEIGSDILEKGGSAVDSAIASLLCVGIMNAHSMGIGGGFFMTVYNKETNTADIINARETAPAGASENMYASASSTTGGLAVAVPGEIRGYWEAHQRYGKLPWRDLFQPAIQLAEEGFCIGKAMAIAIDRTKDGIESPDSHMCDVFCDENNNVLGENQIMKWPKLAETLRAVADGGADAFYTGDIARNLAKDIQDANGIITEQDLRDYEAEMTSPLNITLDGGMTVLSPPPPSSGAVLSLILNILDGYRLNASSVDGTDNQILTYHRIVEAFKFAYAKRTELGDPNFIEIDELVRNMTSGDFADSLRLRIDDAMTHNYTYYGPSFALTPDGGTAHLSVLGPNGDAVSVTSTINLYFGAKLLSPSTGVLLNDEMDDFSSPNQTNFFGIPASPANFIRPGKRPLSSMSPAIVLDSNNDVRLVVGAAGGTKITTATAYAAIQNLWLGLDIKDAVEKPRLHHQLVPQRVDIESSRMFTPEAVLDGLRRKGHVTYEAGSAIVQAVAQVGSAITAACDSIKGGFPSGF
ncbi:glutathione hydrolase 1 proenzyme-like isoform X2 [Branchiostoma floridae]|uniref:Glutathione hydrolase n=1 Tax=Branchiostoma floridae TaxID=7739 RepID=A0A9J7LZ20_BRAFL|nr:glutathione hydrolase 1 proenzyme-like isoform X2 [Branchiostoma floridae]